MSTTFPAALTPFERAQLRLQAFAALKGWGQVREDSKWKSWDGNELKVQANRYAIWAVGAYAEECHFCGKSRSDVAKLIAGPIACICNECIDLCVDILGETAPDTARGDSLPLTPAADTLQDSAIATDGVTQS